MNSASLSGWGSKLDAIVYVVYYLRPGVLEGFLDACLETTSAKGNKEPCESPCWGSSFPQVAFAFFAFEFVLNAFSDRSK